MMIYPKKQLVVMKTMQVIRTLRETKKKRKKSNIKKKKKKKLQKSLITRPHF